MIQHLLYTAVIPRVLVYNVMPGWHHQHYHLGDFPAPSKAVCTGRIPGGAHVRKNFGDLKAMSEDFGNLNLYSHCKSKSLMTRLRPPKDTSKAGICAFPNWGFQKSWPLFWESL